MQTEAQPSPASPEDSPTTLLAALTALAGLARDYGATETKRVDEGAIVLFAARFGSDADALHYRDRAARRLAELGLDSSATMHGRAGGLPPSVSVLIDTRPPAPEVEDEPGIDEGEVRGDIERDERGARR